MRFSMSGSSLLAILRVFVSIVYDLPAIYRYLLTIFDDIDTIKFVEVRLAATIFLWRRKDAWRHFCQRCVCAGSRFVSIRYVCEYVEKRRY